MMQTQTDNAFIYYQVYTAVQVASRRVCHHAFSFTLCTVVEAVDSVKCRLNTDSAVLLRKLLGVLCNDAICLRLLQGWHFHLLHFYYGYCKYGF